MELGHVFTDSLDTSNGKRPLDVEKVTVLMESIKELGLQQPIHVWASDDTSAHIVAGRHRAEACRRLGWDEIPCIFVEMDDIDRERWEIAENLHRAELTALQQSEHIERWKELTLEKLRQVSAVCEGDKGGRGKKAGNRAAARELGVDEKAVRNAGKVAGLSDDAKKAAQEEGLDDNQSALVAAAKHKDDPEAQVSTLKNWRKPVSPPPEPRNDIEVENAQMAALMNAWNRANADVRRKFLDRVQTPIMDQRYA